MEGEPPYSNEQRDYRRMMVKTEMCRRFRKGVCRHGAECDFAHSIAELRTQPKICRLFLQNGHCPYGRNCRYLHYSNSHQPFSFPNSNSHIQLQPEQGTAVKFDGYCCAENKRMRTCAGAPSDVNSCSEYRMMMQPSNAETNAPTSSSHKNEEPPPAVKCVFKHNDIQKISRIYADWI